MMLNVLLFQLAMDQKKRLFSWGFGGYGRLGHAEQKDEPIPRLVKVFEGLNKGVCQVAAGATFGLAVNECGTVMIFTSLHVLISVSIVCRWAVLLGPK
jgi:alpha-tubulin suppressor-like RCC1 family protein